VRLGCHGRHCSAGRCRLAHCAVWNLCPPRAVSSRVVALTGWVKVYGRVIPYPSESGCGRCRVEHRQRALLLTGPNMGGGCPTVASREGYECAIVRILGSQQAPAPMQCCHAACQVSGLRWPDPRRPGVQCGPAHCGQGPFCCRALEGSHMWCSSETFSLGVRCGVERPPAGAHAGAQEPAWRAGKSTLLRATCVAVVLAQMGCPVPAASARLTVTDQIFTRLGRSSLRPPTAPADQHNLNQLDRSVSFAASVLHHPGCLCLWPPFDPLELTTTMAHSQSGRRVRSVAAWQRAHARTYSTSAGLRCAEG